jgi:hypothetical protein
MKYKPSFIARVCFSVSKFTHADNLKNLEILCSAEYLELVEKKKWRMLK